MTCSWWHAQRLFFRPPIQTLPSPFWAWAVVPLLLVSITNMLQRHLTGQHQNFRNQITPEGREKGTKWEKSPLAKRNPFFFQIGNFQDSKKRCPFSGDICKVRFFLRKVFPERAPNISKDDLLRCHPNFIGEIQLAFGQKMPNDGRAERTTGSKTAFESG